MKQYEFLTRLEYFQILVRKAENLKPGEHFWLATMDFDPDEPHIAELLSAMCTAAKRGAHITFLVDAISLLTSDHGLPILSLSRNKLKTTPGSIAARRRALEALRIAGAICRIINVPTKRVGFLQQGRSHIKCAVIGSELFIGGCNLTKPEQIDVMVHWRDAQAARVLAGWLSRIAENGQTRQAFGDVDIESLLNSSTNLLLDVGVPGQSIIYEEASSLIDAAQKRLDITCQYFPGGETAKHLAAAQARGVGVTIKYSHPHAHNRAAILHYTHQLAQRSRRLPKGFFSGRLDKKLPKLHAKILVSENAAMVGSHNYVVQGVNLGTAELALKSTDPIFGQYLREFMERQIASVS